MYKELIYKIIKLILCLQLFLVEYKINTSKCNGSVKDIYFFPGLAR